MADMIVNHVSSSSPQFQDWLAKGPASQFAGMFLTYGSAGQAGQDSVEDISAHVIEIDVDAAGRVLPQCCRQVLTLVVDRGVEAELL